MTDDIPTEYVLRDSLSQEKVGKVSFAPYSYEYTGDDDVFAGLLEHSVPHSPDHVHGVDEFPLSRRIEDSLGRIENEFVTAVPVDEYTGSE